MKDAKRPYAIVYEDAEILVVEKKRDVLTIRTSDKKTWSHNLYHYLKLYLDEKGEKIFIVHRLDFETSGLLIFAKTGAMKAKLQACFAAREVLREYECVIAEALPCGKAFHLEQYLQESGERVGFAADPSQGKLSITDIEAVNPIGIGTACRVRIATGRHNQIRLALAALGLTLLGDRRYAHHAAKRMYLNAYHLRFPESLGLKQSDFRLPTLWLQEGEPSEPYFRLVKMAELPQVMAIIAQAKALLAKNSRQWQDGYPDEATMREDIEKRRLHGVYRGDELLGFAALVTGINENYLAIEGGEWLTPSSESDLVIHRIAVKEGHHGEHLGLALMKQAEIVAKALGCSSLKIDTHPANLAMQRLCAESGYSYRGIIRILREKEEPERLAYEKSL